jgi:hypothetical protein
LKVSYTLSCESETRPEAEYALSTCLSALGLFFEELDLSNHGTLLIYGPVAGDVRRKVEEGEWAVRVLHDREGFSGIVSGRTVPDVSMRFSLDPAVPVLVPVSEEDEGNAIAKMVRRDGAESALLSEDRVGGGGFLTIHFDLLAGVFFFLSRIEEVSGGERDQFERFPQERTLCASAGFELEPVVNRYLLLLERSVREAASRSGRSLLKKLEWPGGEAYCVSATHDVDRLAKWRGRSLLKGVISGKVLEVARSLRDVRLDPWWNFDTIREMERNAGIGSSFYFFGLKRGERGGRYDCRDIGGLLKELSSSGCEIGLHGSFGSMFEKSGLEAEKLALERAAGCAVSGVRQHYLRFHPEKTVSSMDHIGFDYDASVGFSDRVGFRSSMCLPYRPFGFDRREAMRIVEVPLALMDGGLPKDEARRKEIILKLVANVRRTSGLLSLLWHQRSFDGKDFPGLSELFGWTLAKTGEDAPYFATHEELCRWWRAREAANIGGLAKREGELVIGLELEHDLPRISFEIFNPRGTPRVEGALLEGLKSAGESFLRLTVSRAARPGFHIILKEDEVE